MVMVAVVRPESDNVENVLSTWAGLVLTGVSGALNVSVTDIRGRAATRPTVQRQLRSTDALVYFGHGEEDKLGLRDVLIDSANVSGLSKRVLISIACKAAAKLGPTAIANGVRAFLGFDDELVAYLAKPSVTSRLTCRIICGKLSL